MRGPKWLAVLVVLMGLACAPAIDGVDRSDQPARTGENSSSANEDDLDRRSGGDLDRRSEGDLDRRSEDDLDRRSESDATGQGGFGRTSTVAGDAGSPIDGPSGQGNPQSAPAGAATVWPLTGLPIATGASSTRPAVVVKIDNHENARPQYGLNDADLLYEQVVEHGLTRFAAVFHSTDIDMVGPVRSVRTTDYALLSNLGVPLFANSGGSTVVLAGLRAVETVNMSSHVTSEAYWRLQGGLAPHNLMTGTTRLREIAVASNAGQTIVGPPVPLFEFRSESGSTTTPSPVATPTPVAGVDLDYGDTTVTYRWSQEQEGWLRTQRGEPHLDAQGAVVAPDNVVVQFVIYGRSEADPRSPHAELLGQGDVWVFTDGGLVQGRWSRRTAQDPTLFTDLTGSRIKLTPGRTGVALVRVGQAEIVR